MIPLRTEFKRSAAPMTALLIALAGTAMLYAVLRGWGGRWALLALWQREYLFALLPLALGAGAWQARREAKSRVGELFAATPRPMAQRLAPTAIAMSVAAAVGYLAAFAAGAAQVAPTATYFPPSALVTVAVGMVAMVAAVLLGLAVGALLPYGYTPALLTVAGFAVTLSVGQPALGPNTPGADFLAVAPMVHIGQTVWFATLAVTAFGFRVATGWLARLSAVVVAVLGFALAATLLRGGDAVTDPAAVAPVCVERVCVTRVHSAALADVRAPAQQALAIFAAKLPDAPTSVAEATTSWHTQSPRPADTVLLDLELGTMQSERALLWQLLDGAGTRPCPSQRGSGSEHAARAVAAGWLADQEPPRDVLLPGLQHDELVTTTWRAFRALPPDEQRARVRELRTSSLACDGRDLHAIIIAK